MATYKSIKYIIPTEAVEHTDSINALADVDTTTVAPSVGQTLKWSAANSRWQPADIEEAEASSTQKAIFGIGGSIAHETGYYSDHYSMINLVSSSGVVASSTTVTATNRQGLAAASYGGDKAIFGYGDVQATNYSPTNITNLVSNVGVVASDTTGVGTARIELAASGYDGDKAIFGFGATYNGVYADDYENVTNLVSNAGVVASDTTGVGTARRLLAASGYGGDKAIFGFGDNGSHNAWTNITNLVSSSGVVASDTTGVGSARSKLAASSYGGDKAIFGFGRMNDYSSTGITNLVSNTGVVATDTTGVGTSRHGIAASGYGGDKAIFGWIPNNQWDDTTTSQVNLVSNVGVVASDTTHSNSTQGFGGAAAGYSTTA